jgi:cell division protein ZapA (FtsZ GTPase activity inhibitor)
MLPTTVFFRFFSTLERPSLVVFTQQRSKFFQKFPSYSNVQHRTFSIRNNLPEQMNHLEQEITHLKGRIICLESQQDNFDGIGLIGFIFAIYVLHKLYKKEEKIAENDSKKDLIVNNNNQ